VEHSYKLKVAVLDDVDPVRQKNDLSDATEPMLPATIVRGLWRKQGTVGTTHLCLVVRGFGRSEFTAIKCLGLLGRRKPVFMPRAWIAPRGLVAPENFKAAIDKYTKVTLRLENVGKEPAINAARK
jgi:hypothetical protein